MNMPSFTAEASLYQTGRYYRTTRNAIYSSSRMNGTIYAAAIDDGSDTIGSEVIEIEGEAPIEPIWSWWGGLGGQPGGIPMPPGPPGGGGVVDLGCPLRCQTTLLQNAWE